MRKLALITDGWKRWLTYAWAAGILDCIRKRGEDITLFQYNSFGNWSHDEKNNEGEYNIFSLPELSGFDGIITDLTNISDEQVLADVTRRLKDSGLPVISLCAAIDDFYYVGVDNVNPILEIMNHLYDEHGARTFAYLGGPGNNIENRLREETFRGFIKEKGLKVPVGRILDGDFDFDTGVRFMDIVTSDGLPLPDAFVCANDNIAAGLCERAGQLGFDVVAFIRDADESGALGCRDAVVKRLEAENIAVSIGFVITDPKEDKSLSDYITMADGDMYRVKAIRHGQ